MRLDVARRHAQSPLVYLASLLKLAVTQERLAKIGPRCQVMRHPNLCLFEVLHRVAIGSSLYA